MATKKTKSMGTAAPAETRNGAASPAASAAVPAAAPTGGRGDTGPRATTTATVSYPDQLFPKPFCFTGNRDLPGEQSPAKGRTTWDEGFPPVTQMKIREGGIAPNRWDFNGILYLCSRLLWWTQAGGQWAFDKTLDYRAATKDTAPSMVFLDVAGARNGKIWVCVKDNGPHFGGVQTPRDGSTYWQNLYDYLGGLHPEDLSITLTGDVSGSGRFSSGGSLTISATVDPSIIKDAVDSGIKDSGISGGPDYAKMVTVTSSITSSTVYDVPSNGWINVRLSSWGPTELNYVYINGRMVTGSQGGMNPDGTLSWDEVDETIQVSQGDKVTFYIGPNASNSPGSRTTLLQFIPAKTV